MEEQQQQEQQQESIAQEAQEQPAVSEAKEQQPEVVPKSELQKVLDELHKYKSQARELSTAAQADKERLLREGNRWQELAELKDKELQDMRQTNDQIKDAMINEKKFSALKDAAVKAGLRQEAFSDLELVGLDQVQVETTSTGRVNVLGVDQLISNVKLSRPHWFGGQKTNVNGSIPNVNNQAGVVSTQDLVKLSNEAKKSGDYAQYEKSLRQFQQQQRKG